MGAPTADILTPQRARHIRRVSMVIHLFDFLLAAGRGIAGSLTGSLGMVAAGLHSLPG